MLSMTLKISKEKIWNFNSFGYFAWHISNTDSFRVSENTWIFQNIMIFGFLDFLLKVVSISYFANVCGNLKTGYY